MLLKSVHYHFLSGVCSLVTDHLMYMIIMLNSVSVIMLSSLLMVRRIKIQTLALRAELIKLSFSLSLSLSSLALSLSTHSLADSSI